MITARAEIQSGKFQRGASGHGARPETTALTHPFRRSMKPVIKFARVLTRGASRESVRSLPLSLPISLSLSQPIVNRYIDSARYNRIVVVIIVAVTVVAVVVVVDSFGKLAGENDTALFY